jgi:hypothetical protein
MAKVKGIEIVGLEPLLKGLGSLEEELAPTIIRNVARKPANKIVSLARKLFTIKDTGVTKRTFGILKVKDRKQRFLEIGVKGRSLAWIFMLGAKDREKKSGAETGNIKPIGNVIWKAADKLETSVTKEMAVDLNKVIARSLRKYLRR